MFDAHHNKDGLRDVASAGLGSFLCKAPKTHLTKPLLAPLSYTIFSCSVTFCPPKFLLYLILSIHLLRDRATILKTTLFPLFTYFHIILFIWTAIPYFLLLYTYYFTNTNQISYVFLLHSITSYSNHSSKVILYCNVYHSLFLPPYHFHFHTLKSEPTDFHVTLSHSWISSFSFTSALIVIAIHLSFTVFVFTLNLLRIFIIHQTSLVFNPYTRSISSPKIFIS